MTDSNASTRFDALRPYHDDEVSGVLERLICNHEFISTIARYKLPRLSRLLPGVARRVTQFGLRRRMKGTRTVADFQQHIADYMHHMIEKSVTTFTTFGAEHLEAGQAYLFIGNHRDISLDPAFVNLALHKLGRDTVRIAIGDNLLEKPYASDLMRLNKSFIVPRSSSGKREMLKAFQLLSEYIHHSIREDQHSIWIAQRQGRAKSGIDRTDPGIIKMMCLSQNRQPIADVIKSLRIVPVSISYEYDPCAIQKARELQATESEGRYEKLALEDMRSIATGITGHKGRVSLGFGTVLECQADGTPFETVEDVAREIDRQVLGDYTLFPTHMLALEILGGHDDLVDTSIVTAEDRARFEQVLAEVPETLHRWWLQQYANPVLNKAGRLSE